MKEAMHDIAIIGAGPAGATLARLLKGSYRVLLVDNRRLDRAPEGRAGKCCGGLVAPDAQKAIAELGLGLPADVLSGPQLFAVRAVDLASGQERYYQRFYINMDRERFDRWLVSLAPCADTRFGCRFTGYARTERGFRLRLSESGRVYEEEAGILVGADGAASRVRSLAFPDRPAPRRYAAIQEAFEDTGRAPYFTALFDPAITDFYCWAIPKSGRLLVGAALQPGPGAPARYDLLKRKMQSWGHELSQPFDREGALILRPGAPGQICTGECGVALTGEAAGFISPSSCEGISYAMRSASALAGSLAEGPDGFERRYERSTRELRANLLMKNLKSPFLYQPAIRRIILASGVKSLAIRPFPARHTNDKID